MTTRTRTALKYTAGLVLINAVVAAAATLNVALLHAGYGWAAHVEATMLDLARHRPAAFVGLCLLQTNVVAVGTFLASIGMERRDARRKSPPAP